MQEYLWNIDWNKMFVPSISPIEIIIRGTLIYFGVFLLLRFVIKREMSGINRSDLLVIVLIADAAQNGMSGNYQSIPNGILLVAVILFWSFALDWLGFHFSWMERFLEPRALPLYQNKQLLRKNMRSELLTYDEMLHEVRKAGYKDFEEISEIYMEGDGSISVIPYNNH